VKTDITICMIILLVTAFLTGCGTMEFFGGKSECDTHLYHGHVDDVDVVASGLAWSFGR